MHKNSIDGLSCYPVTALLVQIHVWGDVSAFSITASSSSQRGNRQKGEAAQNLGARAVDKVGVPHELQPRNPVKIKMFPLNKSVIWKQATS